MGYRVDRITVVLDVWNESVGGRLAVKLDYVPAADDPLVKLALDENTRRNAEALAANPPSLSDMFFG